MINIYSIEDIIQASENILKSLPKKKDLIQNDDIINEKKMTIDQPLVLKNEITVQSDVPKDIEKIILQAETSQMINLGLTAINIMRCTRLSLWAIRMAICAPKDQPIKLYWLGKSRLVAAIHSSSCSILLRSSAT